MNKILNYYFQHLFLTKVVVMPTVPRSTSIVCLPEYGETAPTTVTEVIFEVDFFL